MKMRDLGYSYDYDEEPVEVEGKKEKKIHYPSVYLNNVELPELDSAKVGDIVMVQFKAKLKEESQSENDDGKKRNSCTLELLEGAVVSVNDSDSNNSERMSGMGRKTDKVGLGGVDDDDEDY